MKRALCSFLALVLCSVAQARTIRVDLGGGGEFTDIQSALDAARESDVVLVAPGEYLIREPLDFNRLHDPNDPASPPLKNLTLRSEAGSQVTGLRMSEEAVEASRRSLIVFENGESERSVLEGFTLTGGKGIGGCPDAISFCGSPAFGGGVYIFGSSPRLVECAITGNSVTPSDLGDEGRGGGVYCSGGSAPRLERCTLSRNIAGGGFGSLYAASGSSPEILACRFTANSSQIGGGIYCASDASVTATNCIFSGNTAHGEGVCDFRGRCWGGAFFCESDSSLTIVNCTLSGNRGLGALFLSGGVTATITNCILWENDSAVHAEGSSGGARVSVSHSCIEVPEPWPGEGNINLDPQFVRLGRFEEGETPGSFDDIWVDGDYHLQPTSPCIDQGTSEGAPGEDIEGLGRPCREEVDIGAHEFCMLGAAPFQRGNANADADLDISDAIFILHYLFLERAELSCLQSADADDSGELNVTDAVYLLGFLFLGGPAPPAPHLGCGVDATADALGCESHPGCT